VVRELQNSGPDGNALAHDVTKFVQTLPPVETQHEKRVAQLRQQQGIEPQR